MFETHTRLLAAKYIQPQKTLLFLDEIQECPEALNTLKYFKEKAKWDEDDHKQGKNQWMENYLRIKSRREVLSMVTPNRTENLDYDIQELIKEEWSDVNFGCPRFFREEGYSVDDEGDSDKLPC